MEAFQSGFAVSLLQDLVERVKSLVIDDVTQSIQLDAEEELKKLQGKILNAQASISSCQAMTPNKAWQYWVGDVLGVCYDAEDLVDDIVFDASKTSVLQKFMSYFTKGSTARKIQELHDRLEDIVKGLKMTSSSSQLSRHCGDGFLKEHMLFGNDIQFKSTVHTEEMFGRDKEKENVISMLLCSDNDGVCIIGMDGLGKTTLARNVVEDGRIRDNFKHIFWVSGSVKFDPVSISQSILYQRLEFGPLQKKKRFGCESSCCASPTDVLSHGLFEEESALIVVDDIWEVKYSNWDSFRLKFLQSSRCKVLITTRNQNVALVTKLTPFYLQKMRDEDCQALIMYRALSFNHLSQRQHTILEGIAGTLAQKCQGLPLAANLMGHLLCSKRSEEEWVNLSERDICDLPVFVEEIFPTFRLNDPDFGYHLKKCLAYCSLFPQNYDFSKDTLVQLWMAEGFILPQGMTNLGDVGCEYFDELLRRSIFQLSGIVDNEWQAYKMHEFIHRFAQFVASDVYLQREEGKCSSSAPLHKKARHLSLIYSTIQKLFLKDIEKCEGLRTLLVLGEHGTKIGQVPYSLFQKLLRLRVLHLSNTDIDELPESVGRLRHLRYLDVSKTRVRRLPESTSELHMLQGLKLRECFALLELPNNTKDLKNLIHLDVDIKGLRSMPTGLGSLTCLQTLPGFIVGKREGNRISELNKLKFLQGTICISNIGNIKDVSEAKEAQLCEKKYIRRLELEWKRYSKDGTTAMEVLAGLQPHNNTRELKISNYAGSRFPDWLTSRSCMLESLHLNKCRQHDVMPSLGILQFLKSLHIEAMPDVKFVDDNFCGESTSGAFPSLESLKIQDMMSLNSWNKLPDNCMQELRELTIEDCPSLLFVQSLRHMRSLQKLEIIRCPELKAFPVLPPSLVSLIIIESDTLKQRCHPEGPDWYFIKSIPYVEIDFTEVSFPGGSS